jgi:hypothetical protein
LQIYRIAKIKIKKWVLLSKTLLLRTYLKLPN